VLAHAEPLALDGETIMDAVKFTAARLGLSVHHVAVRSTGKESASTWRSRKSIGDAHDIATRFEDAV
jgi:hypothetical protein